MKRLILFIALGMGFAAIEPALAQRRNIIWVHGIDSDFRAWNASAGFFNAQRQITSSNRNYGSLNGVPNMATNVQNRTGGLAGNRTIGIGHSMGGLALREVHRASSESRWRYHHCGVAAQWCPDYQLLSGWAGKRLRDSTADGTVEGPEATVHHYLCDFEPRSARVYRARYWRDC